jgi:hypothetical protein
LLLKEVGAVHGVCGIMSMHSVGKSMIPWGRYWLRRDELFMQLCTSYIPGHMKLRGRFSIGLALEYTVASHAHLLADKLAAFARS